MAADAIPALTFCKSLLVVESGYRLQALRGHDEHFSPGAIRVCNHFDDPGRDIS
jgi:hypothetical protein